MDRSRRGRHWGRCWDHRRDHIGPEAETLPYRSRAPAPAAAPSRHSRARQAAGPAPADRRRGTPGASAAVPAPSPGTNGSEDGSWRESPSENLTPANPSTQLPGQRRGETAAIALNLDGRTTSAGSPL